ncbi:zinc finger homeobox protein 2-like isoform X2 [Cherax quadricarinatus]|uniref:zinc finger homeobox protein 2-like isoform X2 n=1 Tax=Cherax quadricarinatus TaxID=27406 RepID=UPI00387EDC83
MDSLVGGAGRWVLVQDLNDALQVGQVSRLGADSGPYRCNVCDQNLASKSSIKAHLYTQKHQNKFVSLQTPSFPARPATLDTFIHQSAQIFSNTKHCLQLSGKLVNAGSGQLVQDLTEAVQVGQVTQLGDEKGPYRCNVCDQNLASKTSIKTHLTTQKHQNKLQLGSPRASSSPPQPATLTYTPQHQQVGGAGVSAAGGWQLVQDLTEAVQVGQVTQLGDDKGPYRCNVCDQNLACKYSIKTHLTTQKHQNKLQLGSPRASSSPPQPATLTYTPQHQQVGGAGVGAAGGWQLVRDLIEAVQVGQVTQLGDEKGPYRCNVCEQNLACKYSIKTHLTTQKHQNKLQLGSPRASSSPPQPATLTYTPQHQQVGGAGVGAAGGWQLVRDLIEAVQVGQVTQLGDEKGPYRCNVCDQNLACKYSIKTHLTTQKHQNKLGSPRASSSPPQPATLTYTQQHQQVGGAGVGAAGGWQLVRDLIEAVQVGQVTQLGDEKGPYRCNVCDQNLACKSSIKTHLTTQKHQNKVGGAGVGGGGMLLAGVGRAGGWQLVQDLTEAVQVGQVTQLGDEKGPYWCNVCDQNLASKTSIKTHLTTQKHQNKVKVSGTGVGVAGVGGAGVGVAGVGGAGGRQQVDELTEAIQAGQVTMIETENGPYCCNVCEQNLASKASIRSHLCTQKHQKMLNLRASLCQQFVQQGPVMTNTPLQQGPVMTNTPQQPVQQGPIMTNTPQQPVQQGPDMFNTPHQPVQQGPVMTNTPQQPVQQGPDMFNTPHQPVQQGPVMTNTPQQPVQQGPVMTNTPQQPVQQGPVMTNTPHQPVQQGPVMTNTPQQPVQQGPVITNTPQQPVQQGPVMTNTPQQPVQQGPVMTNTPQQQEDEVVTEALAAGHVNLMSDGVRYRCNMCKRFFVSPASLRSHVRSLKHQIKILMDEEDEQECGTPRSVSNGSVIETDDKSCPYWCRKCCQPINNIISLKKHRSCIKVTRVNQSSDLKLDEFGSYTVRSIPRGHVYVFNYKFPPPYQRAGAEHDSTNIREIFTELGYKVFIHEDLTKKQTLDTIKDIQKDPKLHNVDSFIAFFLSHGENAYEFQTYDKKRLELKNLRSEFSSTKCPQLKKKPKIFMANYCRGRSIEKVDFDDKRVEVTQDIVTIHATTEGVMALRSRDKGTIFIKCLCDVLRDIKGTIDLRTIYGRLYLSMMRCGGTKPMWEDVGFRNFYFQR